MRTMQRQRNRSEGGRMNWLLIIFGTISFIINVHTEQYTFAACSLMGVIIFCVIELKGELNDQANH